MAQVSVCIRMDADLKKAFELFCSSAGLSMSTAVNLFVKKAVREQRIPFEITAETTDREKYLPESSKP